MHWEGEDFPMGTSGGFIKIHTHPHLLLLHWLWFGENKFLLLNDMMLPIYMFKIFTG